MQMRLRFLTVFPDLIRRRFRAFTGLFPAPLLDIFRSFSDAAPGIYRTFSGAASDIFRIFSGFFIFLINGYFPFRISVI